MNDEAKRRFYIYYGTADCPGRRVHHDEFDDGFSDEPFWSYGIAVACDRCRDLCRSFRAAGLAVPSLLVQVDMGSKRYQLRYDFGENKLRLTEGGFWGRFKFWWLL